MTTNGKANVFPRTEDLGESLTKREYFAAMVLQGLAANTNVTIGAKEMAIDAVWLADRLIDQLNER